jgi:long-chain acyl-CoA synthetase
MIKRSAGLDRGNFFPTAGAALPDAIERFVRSADIPLMTGYGLTETTATVSCTPVANNSIGSVGTVLPSIEMRFDEAGEILLRGESIAKGYYSGTMSASAPEEGFDAEGWLHTGDLGYLRDGQLYLNGRIKDLLKTSNGKYIAPQALEACLAVDRYIDQVIIVADGRQFVAALIVPDFPTLERFAEHEHIAFDDHKDLIEHPQVRALYQKRIEKLQQTFASYEQIKRFALLPEPFTAERGELTDTMKQRRSVITRHYADVIEALYC